MRNPFATRPRRTAGDSASARGDRVIYQVASLGLMYPDDDLLARAGLLRAALGELPASASATALTGFVDHLSTAEPAELRRHYVEIFDLSRRQTLYLTYWSDGDTRRRGSALTGFKQCYRDSGFVVDLDGELPDYLPIVLEFAARVDLDAGRTLLREHRASLELIRISLTEKDSPYAGVLAAICATLPGPSPRDRASALALRPDPPVEQVGLDSGDPRLLPMFTTSGRMSGPSAPGLPGYGR